MEDSLPDPMRPVTPPPSCTRKPANPPRAIAEQSFDLSDDDDFDAGQCGSGFFEASEETLSPSMVSLPPVAAAAHSEPTTATAPPKPADTSVRTVYLATYSRADLEIVPSRKRFAEIVLGAFDREGEAVVEKWACALEPHRKDEAVHYHIAIKLKKARRYKLVVLLLKNKFGIDVHFDEWKTQYADCYGYIVKVDRDNHITSEGHVCLLNPPKTTRAISARSARAAERRAEKAGTSAGAVPPKPKPVKPVKLNKADVARIAVANNIRDDDDLCALAQGQAAEGKHDLENYIYSNPKESERQHVIDAAWKVANAKERRERAAKSKMDILRESLEKSCPCTDCRWLPAALEVLQRNDIPRAEWARIITNNLQNGRCKGCNVMVVGRTNCAKTFMLMPMVDIFEAFTSPAQGKFNWVGAPKKELILLNDFRYGMKGDQEVMEWGMFLNLLDGSPVTIAQPKSHFACDADWRSIQPIFATADGPIRRITPDGRIDQGETSQMNERWVVIEFKHQFPSPDYLIKRCARCFARLILTEEE